MTLNELINRLNEIKTEKNQDLDVAIRYRISPRRQIEIALKYVSAGQIQLSGQDNREYVELTASHRLDILNY